MNAPLPEHLRGMRPSQYAVIRDYNGGAMGIAAVPGSGKTYTLSKLAVDILLSATDLTVDQEILIVTMSNSAVDNFQQSIANNLREKNILPGFGYRVSTLHSLAHEIVRQRPGLVGLSNDFTILDEREADLLRTSVTQAWLQEHPHFFDNYFKPNASEQQLSGYRREKLPYLMLGISKSFIGTAKDLEITPEALRRHLKKLPSPLPLAEMGCDLYEEYQRSLHYRGAVDFDDLIRLALQALRIDPKLATRLGNLWPFILEDEAQDSSRLQQEILKLISQNNGGNWVRVGDPNQAIYDTFTTANPEYLLNFLQNPNVLRKELPVSGRSMPSIIALANYLIEWTNTSHPMPEAREALHPPYIQPTAPNDLSEPQPNPKDDSSRVFLLAGKKYTSKEEHEQVIQSIQKWMQEQQQLPVEKRETLVVLDFRNERGSDLADLLREKDIYPVELLKNTQSARHSAKAMALALRIIGNPENKYFLANAFEETWRKDLSKKEDQEITRRAVKAISRLNQLENYLYPLPGRDWLETDEIVAHDPDVQAALAEFRPLVHRWHAAALLPIDQIILTIAQDIFKLPVDLAIAHQLALTLGQLSNSHPVWQLPELIAELENIANNKRRFTEITAENDMIDPNKYPGQVVITTFHKAKGLEWDRVYLLSANNYNFPSGDAHDEYRGETYFIRGSQNPDTSQLEHLDLEKEAIQQLKVALSKDEYLWYEEGKATLHARADCVCERLRLLYVGITRAKKCLIVTWNTGRAGNSTATLPVMALKDFQLKRTL